MKYHKDVRGLRHADVLSTGGFRRAGGSAEWRVRPRAMLACWTLAAATPWVVIAVLAYAR